MAYEARIIAAPEYLRALGQALYNFTYLEWVVIWTIAKLGADGFRSVPRGKTARDIAGALDRAIANTSPPLESELRWRLVKFAESYRAAIPTRNKLLHAHPFTAEDGQPQLAGGGVEWPLENVHAAAKQFEDAAIVGNNIFHGELAKARP